MIKLPIFVIVIVGIVVVSVGLYSYSISPKPIPISINQISNSTGEVTLAMTPASLNTILNTESTLTLTANTGNVKLVVITVELAYDPTKISTPIVTIGNFLPNILSSPKVENGKITFAFAATPDSGGVQGIGEIATIKFQPTLIGISTFAFTANSTAGAINSAGERIPGNTLRSAEDAIITVSNTIQPSASPIINPSSSPATNPLASQSPLAPLSSSPAQNNIFVVSTANQPTTKPIANSLNVNSNTIDNAENNFLIATEIALNPSFFQKIFLGWKNFIQFTLSLFSN